MPLFPERFAAKKAPARKLDAIAAGYRSPASSASEAGAEVSVTLGDRRAVFAESVGRWQWDGQLDAGVGVSDALQRQLEQVVGENRLLRVKVEILMDLVSREIFTGKRLARCVRSCHST